MSEQNKEIYRACT